MSAVDLHRGGLPAVPEHARVLGSRVKPIIRLGMGVKDEARKGAPRATDYFTVRGDERAVAKFKAEYGDTPKAVKIMVPSELSLALDISYRSFVGGGDEGGGRPLALGRTNFAPLGYVGGPDVLSVWKQDGTFAEVETAGLDAQGIPLDETAEALEIAVYTSFTFTIPNVLGWGSFCQIVSKGRKSADNLVFKCGEIYSAFGSKAPWAFDKDEPPLLVLKPDTALTRFTDQKTGEIKWGKSKIHVLDIVIPEAFDDMRDRLLKRQAMIGDPGAALYGGARAQIPAAAGNGEAAETPPAGTPDEPVEGEVVEDDSPAEPSAGSDPEPGPVDEAAAAKAGETVIPNGQHEGKTIAAVAKGSTGESWINWCIRQSGHPCQADARTYAEHFMPAVYQAAVGQLEVEGEAS